MSDSFEEKVVNTEQNLEEVKMSSSKNKKKKPIIITIIILIIAIIGVFLYFALTKKDEGKTIDDSVEKVFSEYKMSGNTLENFDLKFLQLEANNQNIVYSPLSIKYALSMLSEGASGTSKAQIDALIGEYKAKKYINSSNMSFANAMFIKNSFKGKINSNYINSLNNKYNAEIVYDEFTNANNINSWINNKTLGLINNLVDNVNDKQFYLINALAIDMGWNKFIQATAENYNTYRVEYNHEEYQAYINVIVDEEYKTLKFANDNIDAKAVEIGASINNYDIVNTLGEKNIRETISKEYQEWLDKNKKENSEDVETFVNRFIKELDSNYKSVNSSTDFKFYIDDDVKVFSKDLKEYNGTTLEYIGIMPRNNSLNEFINNSNADSLNNIISKIKTIELNNFEKGKVTKIIGSIPLFKYDYEINLMNDLKKLGITDIFTEGKANLTGITNDNNTVVEAVHKSNIEFSNEGIKAAAVTLSGGEGDAGEGFEHLYPVPVVEIDLTFNNPYLYLIRDKNSGEVWFVGTVYQPTENVK